MYLSPWLATTISHRTLRDGYRALPAYGFAVQSAQLAYRPKSPVTLGEAERTEVEAFLETIDADDDVQNVFVGLAG